MENNKVLGIETNKYAKVAYILILISTGFAVFSNLAVMAGTYPAGGMLLGLLGLAGLIMAALGLFVFQENFSKLDLSHFKYIGLMFIAFFIISMIFSNAMAGFGFIGAFINFLISSAALILIFAGYRTHKAGIEATKASIESDIKSMACSAKSKVQKNQSSGPQE